MPIQFTVADIFSQDGPHVEFFSLTVPSLLLLPPPQESFGLRHYQNVPNRAGGRLNNRITQGDRVFQREAGQILHLDNGQLPSLPGTDDDIGLFTHNLPDCHYTHLPHKKDLRTKSASPAFILKISRGAANAASIRARQQFLTDGAH